MSELTIKAIRVDEGPMHRYFKPGAMGRTNIYRKRLSHIEILLEPIAKKD
jgi:ribosomal protein L22